MKYLLLIYRNETNQPQLGDPALRETVREYREFAEALQQSGQFLAAEALMPVSTATTVRVRNGEPIVTDGPFAETKEHLGGVFMIDSPNLDAAIAWASRVPGARTGSVEIRPVLDVSQL